MRRKSIADKQSIAHDAHLPPSHRSPWSSRLFLTCAFLSLATRTAPFNPRYSEVGPFPPSLGLLLSVCVRAQLIPVRNIYLDPGTFAYYEEDGADESTGCVVFPRGR